MDAKDTWRRLIENGSQRLRIFTFGALLVKLLGKN